MAENTFLAHCRAMDKEKAENKGDPQAEHDAWLQSIIYRKMEREKETDRQTGRQPGRQADRQPDSQTGGEGY